MADLDGLHLAFNGVQGGPLLGLLSLLGCSGTLLTDACSVQVHACKICADFVLDATGINT